MKKQLYIFLQIILRYKITIVKTLLILLALIGLSVPIAASLGWLGLILQYTDSPMPLYRAISDLAWQTSTDFLLVAIPMFVMMMPI